MTFRRKPQVITAQLFMKDKQPWPDGVCICANDGFWGLHVHTPEGTRHLTDHMWVLRDLEGNFTCMGPEDFENIYEPMP
jgi:hypothetical protein